MNVVTPDGSQARAIYFGFLHMLYHAELARGGSRLYYPRADRSFESGCRVCGDFDTASPRRPE